MNGSTIVQFEITGSVSDRLQSFYASLFGWRLQRTGTSDYARVPQWVAEHRAYEVAEAGISFSFVADPEGHVIGLSQGLQHALGAFAAAPRHPAT